MSPIFASPSQQLFSVPYYFILHMIENPACPEGLAKLQQTCKFFYAKHPILVSLGDFAYRGNQHIINQTTSKLWVASCLRVSCKIDHHKFYRFSPKSLYIQYFKLSLQDFELLIAENTVEICGLIKSQITDANVDTVLEKLPNVTHFSYYNDNEIYSLGNLQAQRNIKFVECSLTIPKVSADFSPSVFVEFMKRNGNVPSTFNYYFTADLSFIQTEFIKFLSNWKDQHGHYYRHENWIQVNFTESEFH